MLSPLRNRFGIPGVISVIAVVFAMFGGAYAASNSGGDSKASDQATASAKAKRGPRGPKGPAGPAGPAGAQGPAGPQGPAGAAGAKGDKGDKGDKGEKGEKGEKGATGSAGTAGKSAEAIPFTGAKGPVGGVTCTEGGLEVKSASATTLVCNGKKGEDGEGGGEGSFPKTLPSGETETGAWISSPSGFDAVALSFNIPLDEAPEGIHYVNDAGEEITATEVSPEVSPEPENCHGTALAPSAAAGHICIYAEKDTEGEEPKGKYSPFGLNGLHVYATGATFYYQWVAGAAYGTWAVTAP